MKYLYEFGHFYSLFFIFSYGDHLSKLSAHGGSRPAQGNARMVIPKANFGLPGQTAVGLVRRRTIRATAKRTTSYPAGAAPQQQQQQQAGQQQQQGQKGEDGELCEKKEDSFLLFW